MHYLKNTVFLTLLIIVSCSTDSEDIALEETIDDTADIATDNLPDISGYPIVGTEQTLSYDNNTVTSLPASGADFFGQNSNYLGTTPDYHDNGDGTVTDKVTGLMWTQSPDLNNDGVIDTNDKIAQADAEREAAVSTFAGYDDWRLPTIKELYSLAMFYGAEPEVFATAQGSAVPYIDTDMFEFAYGDLEAGERIIDAQYASSTIYTSTTMNGDKTMFGFNFADGRIKGYPTDFNPTNPNEANRFYVRYVRGNTTYGVNDFFDNGDGTITDNATGLMWKQDDEGSAMLWEDALEHAENHEFASYSDWRLPDTKELQSIIDYSRSPATTNSAAIDDLFNATQVTNEAGQTDYPMYWTNTTFSTQSQDNGAYAIYLCFGRAMGYINGEWLDVHGAGAQRSDPKTGNPDDYPEGHGPQGDAIRINNFVRLVRYAN